MFGLLDNAKGFNTLSYEHSALPSTYNLALHFKNTPNPVTLAHINEHIHQIKVKSAIMALITIPIGPATNHIVPREIQINTSTILREHKPLISQ